MGAPAVFKSRRRENVAPDVAIMTQGRKHWGDQGNPSKHLGGVYDHHAG